MEEKLLKALRERAYKGACRIEDKRALARELGVSVGKVASLLYSLNAEGRILQDKDIILLLCE